MSTVDTTAVGSGPDKPAAAVTPARAHHGRATGPGPAPY